MISQEEDKHKARTYLARGVQMIEVSAIEVAATHCLAALGGLRRVEHRYGG